MAEVLLINGAPGKKRRTATKRRTTAKRKAPAKRRATARRAPARRAPARTRRRRSTKKAASTAGRVLRYRRNPIPKIDIKGMVAPAAFGAVGALGLDFALGNLPIPSTLKVGPAKYVLRSAGAIGLGLLVGAVTKNRNTGKQVAVGALTIVGYDTIKGLVQSKFPTVQLAGLADEYPMIPHYGNDLEGMGEFIPHNEGVAGFIEDRESVPRMPDMGMSGMDEGAFYNPYQRM